MADAGRTGEGDGIGFGIVGCGTIGPLHAEAIAGLPGAHLVGAADLQPERSADLTARWGGKACASLEELLGLADLDVVCVCTPSGLHGRHGEQVARSGRHVVVEKPVDVDPAAAQRLIDACEQAGVRLSVISQHRFDPAVRRVRDALAEGRLGDPLFCEGRAWWYRTQGYYDAGSWRGTHAMDGGALLNQGVHLVDLMLWMFGPARGVFARGATVAHDIEAEDLITATVQFDNGALGSLSVSTAAFPGRPETLLAVTSRGTVELHAGELASWQVEGGSPGDDGPGAAPVLGNASLGSRGLAVTSHRAQLADVADAIRSGRQPAVTGEDGLAALSFVHAAYESLRVGAETSPRTSRAAAPQPLAGRGPAAPSPRGA